MRVVKKLSQRPSAAARTIQNRIKDILAVRTRSPAKLGFEFRTASNLVHPLPFGKGRSARFPAHKCPILRTLQLRALNPSSSPPIIGEMRTYILVTEREKT